MTISLRQQVSCYSREKRSFFLAKQRGIPVYRVYFFSGWEKMIYVSLSLCVVILFAYFFYRSFWAIPVLSPVGVAAYLLFQKEQGQKRRYRLEKEFKDCILSVSANLRAGYSVENAFLECRKDMLSLYGENGLMLQELIRLKKGLYNNVPLEQILGELGTRSFCGNIKEFAEVFAIARKSGGNLPEIIRSTTHLIGEEISLKQEIRTSISGKVLEQKIMTVIPFFMVSYVEAVTPGFFDVLYHNLMGYIIMTICLFVYLAAYLLARKICRIVV